MSKNRLPQEEPGPSLKAVEASSAPAMKVLTDVRMAADEAQTQIARARAALWLLDQMECGELGFVSQSSSRRVTSWWTSQVGDMTEKDLHGWAADMCVQTIGGALKEAAAAAGKAVHTALVAEGKAPSNTARKKAAA